jgi:TatA/E family protein of Tat protein translocase
MFNIGTQEMVLILLVVLLLFGAKRIPEISRSLGKGLADFRDAMAGVERELKGEPPVRINPQAPPASVHRGEPVDATQIPGTPGSSEPPGAATTAQTPNPSKPATAPEPDSSSPREDSSAPKPAEPPAPKELAG